MKYRPEIDGLRALAVVPVILFHAGFELFGGGFVGVDVFFVISGYLITTILIEELETGRFSIVKFYERRARRILPALFFIMLLCLPFAWIWMLPSQLTDFAQSLVAVSLFASNVLFWRESGYFDAAAEEKPLLHTWSLAVEEQYYVLFPIFLLFAWRFGKNRVFWMIVVMAAISLALSEWGWRNKPTANFYLAPTRAWELFAGSIAAFVVHKRGVQENNILALAGLIAVVFAIFAFDKTTPFPSVYALVPVLGVVLLVLFAGQGTLAARVLSTKACVGIGLISYSAYLWHQPLFAFARMRLHAPDALVFVLLSIATLPLAYLTWKYIEAPFRNRSVQNWQQKGIFIFSSVGLLFFMVIGSTGHVFDGFKSRTSPDIQRIYANGQSVKASCLTDRFDDCVIGTAATPVEFVLVGDSHAGRFAYGLEQLSLEHDFRFRVIGDGWCAPLINWTAGRSLSAPNPDCFPKMDEALRELAQGDTTKIILSAEWGNYTQGYRAHSAHTLYSYVGDQHLDDLTQTNASHFEHALRDTIAMLEAAGKDVFILEPVPEYDFPVPDALAKALLYERDYETFHLPMSQYRKRNQEFFDTLSKLSVAEANIIGVKDFFCNDEVCIPYTPDGMPLYSDENHLSVLGLARLKPHFLSTIVAPNE